MKKRLLALISSSAFIATVFLNPLPANAVGETDDLVLKIDLGVPQAGDKLELVFTGPTENLEIDWLGDGNFIAYDATTAEYSNGVYNYGSDDAAERTVTVRGPVSDRFTFGKGQTMQGANLITKVEQFPVWIDNYFGSFMNAINLSSIDAVPDELPQETVDGVSRSVVISTSRMFAGVNFLKADINSWDTSRVTDMSRMFSGAYDTEVDISAWDTSSVQNMSRMFENTDRFNSDISAWETSSVQDMSFMFQGTGEFNADISDWDTSSVEKMGSMFYEALEFNADISAWNTSNVQEMDSMFQDASKFKADISDWNTSNVQVMGSMFSGALEFNSPIGSWNVSSVKKMGGMFEDTVEFDQELKDWDVSSVDDMSDMFEGTKAFNRDLGDWDVSSVIDMSDMFKQAMAFNGDINDWDVSSVNDMTEMFIEAEAFNRDINDWDVSSVEDMTEMFRETVVFNQDLNDWKVSSVETMEEMFRGAAKFNGAIGSWDLSSASLTNMKGMFRGAPEFNQPIGSWDVSSVEDMDEMFSGASSFNQYVGGWKPTSADDVDDMFTSSAFSFCLPESFFPVIGGIQTDYETVGLSDLSADPPVDFSATCVTYVPPAPARPYYGPISRPLAQTEAIAGEEVTVSGFRLDVVERVTVGDQPLEIVSKESSALVLMVPENLSGMVSLGLHWRNGERTGTYRVFEALSVSQPEVEQTPQPESSSNQKINAGSFKGFVAVYALGYEGHRLSAKIGNDWVIVDPIVNNETASLARIVDFTGAGVDINLRVFIDRELVMTVPLTTK